MTYTYHVYLFSESAPPGVLATFDGKELPPADDQQQASRLLWDALAKDGRENELNLYRIYKHDESGKVVMQEKVSEADWLAAQKDAEFALSGGEASAYLNGMIAARHLYGIAAKLMHDYLKEARHEDGSALNAVTFDVFASIAGDQAARQPVEGMMAVRTLDAVERLVPLFREYFAADVAAYEQSIAQQRQDADKLRRSALIRFSDRGDSVTQPLSRNKPMVIVGEQAAVLAEIDQRVLAVLRQTYAEDQLPHAQAGVLRFKLTDAERLEIVDAPYIQIAPLSVWSSAGRNKKRLGELIQNKVADMLRDTPIDVIVIDDLGKFGNNLLTAGSQNPSPVVLADAFKLINDYAKAIGVGLIIGLPWAGPFPPDTVKFLSSCQVVSARNAPMPAIITE